MSGETFALQYDANLDLFQTVPQPALSELPRYYESDDYISHTDGRRTLFEKMYQTVKSYALKQKLNLIQVYHPGKGKLLDIGAGTGDFLATAEAGGWTVSGVEPSEKARHIATAKGLGLVANTLDLEDHQFDVITLWHVLEHVPDPWTQLAELKRLLKPNGTLIVAVPNFNSFDAKFYGAHWAAYDVPRHLWHFSQTAIKKLFNSQKMELKKVLPMKFDAFYVSLLSEKYKTGKMNFVRALCRGIQSNAAARRSKEYSSLIYVLQNA